MIILNFFKFILIFNIISILYQYDFESILNMI